MTRLSHTNGTYIEMLYSSRDFMTDIRNKGSDGSVTASFSYSYDSVGNRTAVLENDGTSVTFGYDELYRLISEKRERDGNLEYRYEYTYDAHGNRLKKVAKSATGTVLEEWTYSYNK